MQKILGKQRIALFIFLILLNGALYWSLNYQIKPLKKSSVQEYESVQASINKRRRQIRQLRREFMELLPKIRKFKIMKKDKFFNNQKRTIAQKNIQDFRDRSNLLLAKYEIEPAKVIKDKRAQKADRVLLSSPVNIRMEALDDLDIYTFLRLMQTQFPGNIDLRELTIERKNDLDRKLLQKVASGEPRVLMTANMKFHWRTMTSERELNAR